MNLSMTTMNRIRIPLLSVFVSIFLLGFGPATMACTLQCHGEYDPIGTRFETGGSDGVAYCYGTIEWNGCDAEDPPVGGGGGGSARPNLTASMPTPAMAFVGEGTLFSTTVTNLGNATANASKTRFQRTTNANGSGAVWAGGEIDTTSITAGASRTASRSLTLPTAGTWYVRACADVGGTVAESSETDNCGAWRTVVVHEQATGGSCGMLYNQWHTGAQTQIYSELRHNDGQLGTICPAVAANAGYTFWNQSIVYTTQPGDAGTPIAWVTCYGVASPTGTQSKPVESGGTIAQPTETSYHAGGCAPTPPPTPAVTLTANPTTVTLGNSTTLTWSSSNSEVCSSADFTTNGATSGSVAVSPTASKTYTVQCTSPGASGPGTYAANPANLGTMDLYCPGPEGSSHWAYGTNVLPSMPACPANPVGKSCTTNCKVQWWSNSSDPQYFRSSGGVGNQCNLETQVYYCQAPAQSPPESRSASVSVIVAAPNLRITAGPTPTSVPVGESVVYSVTMNNNGTANAGATHTRFQRATSASGAGATTISDRSTSATNAAASRTVTQGYAHATAGTFWMRACADINGVVTESNEGDNCSAWTAITVTQNALSGGTCAIAPGTSVMIGQQVTRTVSGVTGGSGAYTYAWSGTDSLSGSGTSVAKTYATVGTKTAQVVVSATGVPNHTITCTNVSVGGQADLTTGAITPTSVTANQSSTFSVSVSNSGAVASGASSPTLFQRATSSGGANAITLGVANTASLTAGQSRAVTLNAALPTGTWYLRACADNNASWAGTITESNEDNNCGAWTRVVAAAPPPVQGACTVNKTTVAPGESFTYTAQPQGASSYEWGTVDGTEMGGYQLVQMRTTPGWYDTTVRVDGGTLAQCPRVTVEAPYCATGAQSLNITANPVRVRSGQTTTISWNATNILGQNATCSVSGPGISWSSAVSEPPLCAVSGSATPTITTQSVYTLTCGHQSDTVVVNVIPQFEEF